MFRLELNPVHALLCVFFYDSNLKFLFSTVLTEAIKVRLIYVHWPKHKVDFIHRFICFYIFVLQNEEREREKKMLEWNKVESKYCFSITHTHTLRHWMKSRNGNGRFFFLLSHHYTPLHVNDILFNGLEKKSCIVPFFTLLSQDVNVFGKSIIIDSDIWKKDEPKITRMGIPAPISVYTVMMAETFKKFM